MASVCLFAQFDPESRLAPHVAASLGALRDAGIRTVVAWSGPAPDASARAGIAAAGAELFVRENGGLDFGAWRDLISAGAADGADAVLLANDSVFGPFAPLAPTIERMRGFDVWGMAESRERGWHLQSWFVWLQRAAFDHPSIRRVLAQDFPAMSKDEIILHGEIGLGAAIMAAGLRAGAVGTLDGLPQLARLAATNPMHHDWRVMLRRGVPYLKIELLRDDPLGAPGLDRWRQEVAARAPDFVPLIEAHLARVGERRRSMGRRGRLMTVALSRDRVAALRELFRR